MSPVDVSLIHRKAKLIEGDLQKLQDIRAVPLGVYLVDDLKQAACERILERIIGRLIDINYHFLTQEFHEMPEDYFDSFLGLSRHGIVAEGLASDLARSTGLRNVLAHEYDEIDSKKVYEAIHQCLQQVPLYLSYVLKRFEV